MTVARGEQVRRNQRCAGFVHGERAALPLHRVDQNRRVGASSCDGGVDLVRQSDRQDACDALCVKDLENVLDCMLISSVDPHNVEGVSPLSRGESRASKQSGWSVLKHLVGDGTNNEGSTCPESSRREVRPVIQVGYRFLYPLSCGRAYSASLQQPRHGLSGYACLAGYIVYRRRPLRWGA